LKIGDRFGKLTVIAIDGLYAVCECECGNRKRIRKTSLTDKKQPTRSCGCIQKQIAKKTGVKTIAENSKRQIERNVLYNTNFQVITTEKPPKNNKSGVKGVSWNKERKKWEAHIQVHGKTIHLGRYADFTEAVKVRKRAEEEYYQPLIEEARRSVEL
jgi:hypothetical protein